MTYLLCGMNAENLVETFHPTVLTSCRDAAMQSNAVNDKERAGRFPTEQPSSSFGCSRPFERRISRSLGPDNESVAVFARGGTCASLPFWTWPALTISQRFP